MSRLVFWLSGALLAWTYVAFPLVVLVRARLAPRPVRRAPITPSVSVVIAAHNEAATIAAKLANLRELDYPRDCLEVVIGSDGSTDGTDAIVAGEPGVQLLSLPRVGKAEALNAAVAAASGEILVFSDANSMYDPGALRALVAPFADPEVGGVAGDQRYPAPRRRGAATAADRGDDGGGTGEGERGYWDLDRRLKVAESAAGNVISATGAIYAIRRELFVPVPAGVTDDFVTSARVVAQGRRLVFVTDAIAWEPVAPGASSEFGRKVRVMTRGLRGVVLMRSLLDPRRHGFYSLQLASHKLLRRLMVWPSIGLGLSSLALGRRGPLYRLAAAAQATAWTLAAAGLALSRRPIGRQRILALPAFVALTHAAAIRATWNLLSGTRIDRWDPSERRAPRPDEPKP